MGNKGFDPDFAGLAWLVVPKKATKVLQYMTPGIPTVEKNHRVHHVTKPDDVKIRNIRKFTTKHKTLLIGAASWEGVPSLATVAPLCWR